MLRQQYSNLNCAQCVHSRGTVKKNVKTCSVYRLHVVHVMWVNLCVRAFNNKLNWNFYLDFMFVQRSVSSSSSSSSSLNFDFSFFCLFSNNKLTTNDRIFIWNVRLLSGCAFSILNNFEMEIKFDLNWFRLWIYFCRCFLWFVAIQNW